MNKNHTVNSLIKKDKTQLLFWGKQTKQAFLKYWNRRKLSQN